MRRNISRLKAMIRLYETDLLKTDENIDIFDELLKEYSDTNIDYDKKFSDELYEGVKNNLSKIDKAIAISLDNYPLDRVSYVDRALLRIGTYELIYTDTPTPIIINEIINLSKDYSEVNKLSSSKFNNGVLDKISKTYRDNGSK